MKPVGSVIVTGLVVLAACGASSSKVDGTSSSKIVGKVFATCHQLPADVELPADMSQRAIQAFVPDSGATGYRVIAGTGSADGTFVIDGVPEGTYMLQLGATPSVLAGSQAYVTDQRDLALHSERAARCSPAPSVASAPAVVNIALTGLTTLFDTVRDHMELESYALGYGTQIPFGVNPGDVFNNSVDWPQGAPLVDANAGDDLNVLHVRSESSIDPTSHLSWTITRILDRFDATGKSLQVGPATLISGAFPEASPEQTGTLSIVHDRFRAGYDLTTTPGRVSVQLLAHPVSSIGGVAGQAALISGIALEQFPGSQAPSGTSTPSYTAVDPFPVAWKRALVVEYDQLRYVRLSATAPVISVLGGYRQTIENPAAIAADPQLATPSGVTIAGADFVTGGKLAFDGQSPVVVRWTAVPSAQLYELSLLRSTNDPTTRHDIVEDSVITADTMVVLPAAMLTSGAVYQLALTAIETPTDYRAGQLVPAALPLAAATVPSGRFRFTAHCGDGIVDAGEDCDTAGESASCNVDCTTPMCGDGLRNAAAGEACDSIRDSVGCKPDCTLRPVARR
jgi:hypothetical protein